METVSEALHHETMSTASSGAAMLSMDQVASLFQRMKDEQTALLQQQRDTIVQQVMQNLRDSGVVAATPAIAPSAQSRAPTSPTLRLEQRLHSLVMHSLAESGLDFPHVQRPAHTHVSDAAMASHTQPQQLQQTNASRRQPTIVARVEGSSGDARECRDSTDNVHSGVNQTNALRHVHGDSTASASAADTSQRCVALERSPLVASQRTRKAEKRRPRHSTASRHRARSHCFNGSSDSDDTVDTAFERVRNKVGHRTLAILDKSKALLHATKDATHVVRSGTTNNFVARIRELQTLDASSTTAASVRDDDPLSDVLLRPASANASSSGDASALRVESSAELFDATPSERSESRRSTRQSARRHSPSSSPTQQPDALPSSVPRCDVGLLRPPEHAPQNDNEWENELARQILTIYATSVKAKAVERSAGCATPSHKRPASRAIDSQAASAAERRVQPLASSCSLPALHASRTNSAVSGPPTSHRHRQSTHTSVHFSWEPSQRLVDGRVVVNMPKVPRPIWFAGTGAVKAVWCALAHGFADDIGTSTGTSTGTDSSQESLAPAVGVCVHRLCDDVRRMEAQRQFSACITTLEALLVARVRACGTSSLATKLWKQLVVTCNAFASRCVEARAFAAALQLMQQAETLVDNSVLVTPPMRLELLAFLYDTYAHYYARKHKASAALAYLRKALTIHAHQSSWAHVAKCRLHVAALLSSQRRHADAQTHMAQVLALIEQNKLEDVGSSGASAQKLCLAAVCYNNIAVEQLHLRAFEAASVSAANAKRLARLCLSYSNRWLAQFEATSDCAALAIMTLMEDANAAT